MADNYCSNCGEAIIGSEGCQKPQCKKAANSKGKASSFDDVYPTMDMLKAELVGIVDRLSNRFPFPSAMPKDSTQAAEWWLRLQERPNKFEAPQKLKTKWHWPYAERVKYNLMKFFRLDKEFQSLIVSAWEDNVFWRGDDREFFMLIISATIEMQEIVKEKGFAAFRKQAVAKVKALALKIRFNTQRVPRRQAA